MTYYKNKPLKYPLNKILKASAKIHMIRQLYKKMHIDFRSLNYSQLQKLYNDIIIKN